MSGAESNPSSTTLTEDATLLVEGVSKTYGPVRALRPLSISLRAGEVHGLVGENGSGKSTLVGILSGAVNPDTGSVSVDRKSFKLAAPWESQRAGIITVFQDGTLIKELSVAHNLYLGVPGTKRPAFAKVDSWAKEKLTEYGLVNITPSELAKDLAPGDAQLLDIARALISAPKVLLLDESTSSLDASGVDVALEMMRTAAKSGAAVVFVTHRLSEVFRVAEQISVLRDGEYQGTYPASSVTTQQLVERMAGTNVTVEFPVLVDPKDLGDEILVGTGLQGTTYGPIDFSIRRGEIVGIAGADGNGQLGLLRGLAGVALAGGSLVIGGKRVSGFDSARRAGVSFLSSDRKAESLFPSLAIRENLVSGILKNISKVGYVSAKRENQEADAAVKTFGIRLGSTRDPLTSLSGGNQQKVALSRALVTKPDVLLVEEPTKGVDVRSRIDIYHLLREATKDGRAVVVVSSDASELAGLCDRIIVISRGRKVAEIAGADASEEKIIAAFTSTQLEESHDHHHSLIPRRNSRRFSQDSMSLGLVVLVLLGVGGYAQSQTSTFLTSASINNLMVLTLPLAVVAAAEFLVMFTGGIDVSVGANMGMTVAIMSYVFTSQGSVIGLILCLLLAIAVGIVVGSINAFIVERLRIPAVIATIATLGILQGLGLTFRPNPGGAFNQAVTNLLSTDVGPIPVCLIIVVALFLAADFLLRSTGRGLRLRAVGLNSLLAFRLGENTPRQRQLAYVGCAVLASIAGVLLASQVGIGDSTVGNQYTLLAVAAPILGGAALSGGRGSFIGCLVGALLLALAEALPGVLSLSNGLSYALAGVLTLLAVLVYTGALWRVGGEVVREALLRHRIRRGLATH